ncbi:MAG: acyl--CoA ligase, partial [Gammaproteobacteria bacterium]|nr:acyl--CoA ligase [Gammaproteobacteria bacterium]
MKSPFEWIKQQSKKFADHLFLIDSDQKITYAENFERVQLLMANLQDIVKPGSKIVFFGNSSIESYQLYYAVIALQGVWFPIDSRLDYNEILKPILGQINPDCIIYEKTTKEIIYKLNKDYEKLKFEEIFNSLDAEAVILNELYDNTADRIISAYLTSGSTERPKVVGHGWYATVYHAKSTVNRYPLGVDTRLFNPRPLFGVSGAFPLITLMSCGGSIVIPNSTSYQKNHENFMVNWAKLIAEQPKLKASSLRRITTGGEALEFSELIKIARAFVTYKL